MAAVAGVVAGGKGAAGTATTAATAATAAAGGLKRRRAGRKLLDAEKLLFSTDEFGKIRVEGGKSTEVDVLFKASEGAVCIKRAHAPIAAALPAAAIIWH